MSNNLHLVIPRLSRQLQDTHGIGEIYSRWAVETWAFALNISLSEVQQIVLLEEQSSSAASESTSESIEEDPLPTTVESMSQSDEERLSSEVVDLIVESTEESTPNAEKLTIVRKFKATLTSLTSILYQAFRRDNERLHWEFIEDLRSDGLHRQILGHLVKPTGLNASTKGYVLYGYGKFGGTSAIKEAIRLFYADESKTDVLPIYCASNPNGYRFNVFAGNEKEPIAEVYLNSQHQDKLYPRSRLSNRSWWGFISTKRPTDAYNAEDFLNLICKPNHKFGRVVLMIDKVQEWEEIFSTLQKNKFFDTQNLDVIFLADEHFDQWLLKTNNKKRIDQIGLSPLYVPCVWDKVGSEGPIDILRKYFADAIESEIRSDDAKRIFEAWLVNVVYLSQGSLPELLHQFTLPVYGLNAGRHKSSFNLRAAKINKKIIERNQLKQEVLDQYWQLILGRIYSASPEITDRARIGVYKLLNWIDSDDPRGGRKTSFSRSKFQMNKE